jgi:hypothetical protein
MKVDLQIAVIGEWGMGKKLKLFKDMLKAARGA